MYNTYSQWVFRIITLISIFMDIIDRGTQLDAILSHFTSHHISLGSILMPPPHFLRSLPGGVFHKDFAARNFPPVREE